MPEEISVKSSALEELRKSINDRSVDLSEEVSKLLIKQNADDLIAARAAILAKALILEEKLTDAYKKASVGSKRFNSEKKQENFYTEEQFSKMIAAGKKLDNFRNALNKAITVCTAKNYAALEQQLNNNK